MEDWERWSGFKSEEDLDLFLSHPRPEIIDVLRELDGDILILGASGKMGPTLAMLAKRSILAAGLNKKVMAVSRFATPQSEEKLRRFDVDTVACDLMDPAALAHLPEAANVIYMVGAKFGTSGHAPLTWAVNAFLPGLVARQVRGARIVVFSSGNVYPLSPVPSGGCTEQSDVGPVGEYAQSVLGRERVFEHFAQSQGSRCLFFRLNYAVEMRYGVLRDIADKVWAGQPVDVTMGHVNVLWQGDANAYALRSLAWTQSPAKLLNVTGPETLSVRGLAERFGVLMDRKVNIVGSEQPDALLSNAQEAFRLMGTPLVPVGKVMEWTAAWVQAGLGSLGKPTKFQVRDGRF